MYSSFYYYLYSKNCSLVIHFSFFKSRLLLSRFLNNLKLRHVSIYLGGRLLFFCRIFTDLNMDQVKKK